MTGDTTRGSRRVPLRKRIWLKTLRFRDWHPRSQLRLHETPIDRLAHPAIDVHNHLGRWLTADGSWMVDDVASLIDAMDRTGIESIVNLDGRWADELDANLDRYDRAHPGRFATFCQLPWDRLADADGEAALLASLEDSARRGARGVKVWKDLGLAVRDASARLVMPDDDRVVRVLARAGDLGMPVMLHTADPKAFFDPLDGDNERLDELADVPDRWLGDRTRYPAFDALLDAHTALVGAASHTIFIGAHMGCCAEDLDRVERNLAALPNYRVDIAGRLGELGRQPRRTRELIERFPDRVLFGTDAFPVDADAFRLYGRFLETRDEAFSYAPDSDVPPQGRWTIAALDLPENLLDGVYRTNALSILDL